MALTKVNANVFTTTQITLTGSAGSTASSWIDVQASYGNQLHMKLTNLGTITVGAVIVVETASDSAGVAAVFATYKAPTTASAVTSWSVELPIGVEFFKVTVTHPTYTVTASTLDAEFTKVTAIA